MRRALLFTLVVGTGVLLLFLADGRSRKRMARAAERRAPLAVHEETPLEEHVTAAGAPSSRIIQQDVAIIRGHSRLKVFPTGIGVHQRTHEIEGRFEPVDELGRRYVIHDLVTEIYDTKGALLETIEAKRAGLRLDVESKEGKPFARVEIAERGRIVLEEVTVTRHTGHPLAPLVFRAPHLDAYLSDDRLASGPSEEVQVEGQGLLAKGKGLRYEGQSGFLALERGGRLDFERENGEPLVFLAPSGGPLEVERVASEEDEEESSRRLEVRATQGGELRLGTGERQSRIKARRLTLVGTVEAGGWRLEHGKARGKVLAVRGLESYRGDRADLFADAQGRIERAVLDHDLSARLRVRRREGGERFVVVEGKGPLEVELEGPSNGHFELVGPGQATLEGEDLVIRAEGSLEGWAAEGGSAATLRARRGVEVVDGESRLESDSLDALILAEGRALDLSCEGATRLTTRSDRDELVTFDASERVQVEVRGDAWTLPVAEGVELHVLGDQAMRATAGMVRDYDPKASTAFLSGGVSWVSVSGEADASTVELRGPESALLEGIPGSPARFRMLVRPTDGTGEGAQQAFFSALSLDVTEAGVRADGEVHMTAEGFRRRMVLDASHLDLERSPASIPSQPDLFTFSAMAVREIEWVSARGRTSFSCERVIGGGTLGGASGRSRGMEVIWGVASGEVTLLASEPMAAKAGGERLAWFSGMARLTPKAGERVHLETPTGQLRARILTYDGEVLRAEGVHADQRGGGLPGVAWQDSAVPMATIEAEHAELRRERAEFRGGVLIRGTDREGLPVVFEAEQVIARGDFAKAGTAEAFEAWGGFRGVYGGIALSRGRHCELTRSRLELWGSEEDPAVIDSAGLRLRSTRLALDLDRFLVESDRGELHSAAGWDLSYAALRPVTVGTETLMVLVAPRYARGTDRARADFAAFWLDEAAWRARGRGAMEGAPPAPEVPVRTHPRRGSRAARPGLVQTAFAALLAGEAGALIRQAHLEGSLEVTEQGRTVARASEAWLDLEGQRGWLRDATLVARMDLAGTQRQDRVRVRAKEIITRADGSLRAAEATMTTSTHEVPGYVIRTGELVLMPRSDGMWSFSARPNRIRFKSGLSLPLPPLGNLVLDDKGSFVGFGTESGEVRTIENLTIGDNARHGTEVGGGVRYPIGEWGKQLARLFGFNKTSVRGDWSTDVSLLSSRGLLFGTGLELRDREATGAPEDYWLNLYAKGIDDRGQDRGLVRVDEGDRSSLRTWLYGQGRYPFSRTSWVETQFSTQSDPGVQAEFYENDYLYYEQRDNDVHWRYGNGANLVSVKVKGRIDDYRREVEELPSVGLFGGERTVAHLGKLPVLWRGSVDAAYLRRRPGDPEFEDPFLDSQGAPDGLGEREVLRATTSQRVSIPVRTGLAAITATPWLDAQFTAWDRGEDPGAAPYRAALLGGVDLATTLVRRTAAGYLSTLSPTLFASGDLALEEKGTAVVRFDELEDSPRGELVGAGLRALWTHPERANSFDLSLRAFQITDRGELPNKERIEALGAYRSEAWGRPFGILTDLRVDPGNGDTVYARSTLALAPSETWLFELSHRRGLDVDGASLFETASFDSRWTIDPKWELQLGQDINLLGSGALRSEFIIRRYGADFLFELQILHRAGEGGTTVRINFAPLFLWKRRPLGILERGH